MSLLLFDIDGTLLLSGGAGMRAMTRAFAELFGVAKPFAASDVAGRTDTFILSAALRQAGLADTPEIHQRVRDRYLELLPEELVKPPRGHSGLMPGIHALLDALRRSDSVHLALLTGNFEQAAHIKLGHYGIRAFFEWGAFGEEAVEREELARIAMQRAEARGVLPAQRQRTVVIGDTPHDITCARAIGARAIAVATGNYSVDDLRAAGADETFTDLSDLARVLGTLKA